MKLTKTQLKQIIKEEISQIENEEAEKIKELIRTREITNIDMAIELLQSLGGTTSDHVVFAIVESVHSYEHESAIQLYGIYNSWRAAAAAMEQIDPQLTAGGGRRGRMEDFHVVPIEVNKTYMYSVGWNEDIEELRGR